MKTLEKAEADYEKAKERMEAAKERYDREVKRFRTAQADLTEAENLTYIRIVREMQLTVPELEALKEKLKTELPAAAAIRKEQEHRNDEPEKEKADPEPDGRLLALETDIACCDA